MVLDRRAIFISKRVVIPWRWLLGVVIFFIAGFIIVRVHTTMVDRLLLAWVIHFHHSTQNAYMILLPGQKPKVFIKIAVMSFSGLGHESGPAVTAHTHFYQIFRVTGQLWRNRCHYGPVIRIRSSRRLEHSVIL